MATYTDDENAETPRGEMTSPRSPIHHMTELRFWLGTLCTVLTLPLSFSITRWAHRDGPYSQISAGVVPVYYVWAPPLSAVAILSGWVFPDLRKVVSSESFPSFFFYFFYFLFLILENSNLKANIPTRQPGWKATSILVTNTKTQF